MSSEHLVNHSGFEAFDIVVGQEEPVRAQDSRIFILGLLDNLGFQLLCEEWWVYLP